MKRSLWGLPTENPALRKQAHRPARTFFVATLLILGSLLGCSSGGGSDTSNPPKSAQVTLTTTETGTIPKDNLVTSYDITLALPAGVTLKSQKPPVVDAGVVTLTGSALGALSTAVYTAASGSTPASLRIQVASGSGLNPGAFITINFDLTPGSTAKAADFNPLLLSAKGLDKVLDSTVDLTSQLSLAAAVVSP